MRNKLKRINIQRVKPFEENKSKITSEHSKTKTV
jgi:hypothetical protein